MKAVHPRLDSKPWFESQNATFQKIFEVDRRTILRDIEFLRDRLLAPVEYEAARNGYYFTGHFNLMPPLDLKSEDFLTLYFLQQSLAPYEATEIGSHMRRSFERMFGLLTGTQAWKKWDAAISFRGEPKTVAAGEQLKTFEVLFSAITAKQVVRFEYYGRGKPASKREVERCLIAMNKGRWYLYAVDRKAKAMWNDIEKEMNTVPYSRIGYDSPEIRLKKLLAGH